MKPMISEKKPKPFVDHGPDPQLYPSALRFEQQAAIFHTLRERHGMALIVGDSGMGKTMLARRVVQTLMQEMCVVQVLNPHLPDLTSLFQAILYDLDAPYDLPSEQRLRLAVTDAVLNSVSQGGMLLFVDDAHHLQVDQLEELRLLGNLAGANGRLIQTLLVGREELVQKMDQEALKSLRQCIARRISLHPWSEDTIKEFLNGEFKQAGLSPQKWVDEEAIQLLTELTEGVPRWVQRLANEAYRLAIEANTQKMDAETLLLAAESIGLPGVDHDGGLDDRLIQTSPLSLESATPELDIRKRSA